MALLNNNPANKISCGCDSCDTSDLKSLVFQNSNAAIIQGAKSLFEMSLKDLFFPLEKYLIQDFTILAGDSVQLDPGNISNDNGEVTGILILVIYPGEDSGDVALTEADKYITFTHPLSGDTNPIGKMMMLTGVDVAGFGWNLLASPGGLLLNNPHTNFDVQVKTIIIS